MAGGFKRDALLQSADLTSYNIANGTKVVSQRSTVAIGDAVLRNDRNADIALKSGDVLTIHQITGWMTSALQSPIEGEVAHPAAMAFSRASGLVQY